MVLQGQTACHVKDLGLIEYQRAYRLQNQYVGRVLDGESPVLLLCEHPPVLTLGRLAQQRHLLVSEERLKEKGIEIFSIDRGGDITLHAPGQLVVYPIINLVDFGRDLRAYLRRLEQVAIDLLGGFGILAQRYPGRTGVWAEGWKIVSIGIGVRKWVAFHGLAVNVTTDLSLFSMIKPCGLDVTMASLASLKKDAADMPSVKERLVHCFCRHFHLTIEGIEHGKDICA